MHVSVNGFDERERKKNESQLLVHNYYVDGEHSPEGSMIPPHSTLIFEIEMLGWEERVDVSLDKDKS
jgi:hypothetical protein